VSVPREIFGEDYDYFMADVLGPERSDADADVIARLLALEPGMRILDVPCGDGRIGGRLAQRGGAVTGIDREKRFLARARSQYREATFELGDMRALGYAGEFDAVVNWFTSFGYFDSATNDAVLAGFARALRPGGQLVLELHNPWHFARAVEVGGGDAASLLERGGDLLADQVRYDEQAGISVTDRFVVRNGRVRRQEFSLEQVPAPKLVARLRRAGFGRVELYGQGGAPFEPEGRRLIALATLAPPAPPPLVSLREVTAANVRAVCALKLAPGQERYVAPSAYTLAEAQFYAQAWVRAIYREDAPVGLLALLADTEAGRYQLVRLLISAGEQGHGLGRAAVGLLIDHVRTLPGACALETSCIPGPGGPTAFYRRLGFEPTGQMENGEEVLRLAL
jgi:SAM-dependent methyltransferase